MAEIAPEYNFIGLFEELMHLRYHQTPQIIEVEKLLYQELENNPDNLVGLVVMLQCQIMLGNASKAKSLAHKIWSIGGEISPLIESTYLNCLLNLGMLDMAMVLLKPHIANLAEDAEAFAAVIAKFAVMTGNLSLLEKLIASPVGALYIGFSDFIEAYKTLNYAEHFKNVQKILFDNLKDSLCSYEYQLYFDRGFTDLEAVIYTTCPAMECADKAKELNQKIDGYFLSQQAKRLHNYSFKLYNILEHPALLSE